MSLFNLRYFPVLLLSATLADASLAAGPIRITNIQTLNFGAAAKPLSGNVKVVVNRLGNISPETTAVMIDTSSVSNGEDKIKGSGGSNSIQIALIECVGNSSLGLEIKDFTAHYSGVNFLNSGVALDAPGGGGKILTYGAALVVSSSASTGALSPCYDLMVNYE